jgi:alanyl-tRNA synthetase
MNANRIRATFLKFFESKQHQIVRSAPLVMKNDPTLLFTNSGMNQFKEFFLGNSTPKSRRVADTQKCLRVSGKHNDLEEVGKDTYHHTLFEMLGNWSFGDYFKKEAIEWAWELLTEVYKLDKDRLYVTIFEGSEEDGLYLDKEAYDLWKAFLPQERILKGSKKDNFWEMGDQGPCGPCSEIHIDLRSEAERAATPGAALVNADHPQVVEVWNLVFMQYNRKADQSLEPLPEKHVDTGMGFERLCMALQGKTSNYDTDVFTDLIGRLTALTAKPYGQSNETDIAIRVVVDHVRAVAFAIADGQLPGNTGAGYVIRRILRRAIRYGFTFLDQSSPFVHELVSTLVGQMGEAFPELKAQEALITQVIREEEYSFLSTLEQGLKLLDRVIAESVGKTIAGEKAFELYDTFGFPIDLTALILSERGYTYDQKGFEEALAAQKQRSKADAATDKSDWISVSDASNEGFVGYDTLSSEGVRLLKYREIKQKDKLAYQLVLSKTPFYPEGGGQIGDSGVLEFTNKKQTQRIEIGVTKRENNEIVHTAAKLPTDLEGSCTAKVNAQHREETTSNHSATHLLHQALREVLGTHVEQRGSSVRPDALRFDFSHFAKLSPEELAKVEALVNQRIAAALPLQERRSVPMSQAMADGAMALFGEKYGDEVRTIRFGESIELCGGTHVKNTAEIWYFKIKSEGAVASGIRRIEAITGQAVKKYFNDNELQLEAIAQSLPKAQDLLKGVADLVQENEVLRAELESLKAEKLNQFKRVLQGALKDINGVQFAAVATALDATEMKSISFELAAQYKNLFLVLASNAGGKALLSIYIDKHLAAERNYDASVMVRELGKHIQGGGGGQAFFATAGGKDPQGIHKALEMAKGLIG